MISTENNLIIILNPVRIANLYENNSKQTKPDISTKCSKRSVWIGSKYFSRFKYLKFPELYYRTLQIAFDLMSVQFPNYGFKSMVMDITILIK